MLVPRARSWFPGPAERAAARARVHGFPPERFATFRDYFFFLHIHPKNRLVHVAGMLLGLPIFGLALYRLDVWSVPLFFFGHLFFTGMGVLGHVIYDGTPDARTNRDNALRAFPWVLAINLATLRGTYDAQLRAFVERYPFVTDAWDLVESDPRGSPTAAPRPEPSPVEGGPTPKTP